LADSPPTDETDCGGADEKKLLTGRPLAALLQEALLRTGGTVTDLLELFTDEDIRIDKIAPGI
jgi:hypothetical protein